MRTVAAEFGPAGGRRDGDAGVTGQEGSRAFLAAPAASRQRPLPGSRLRCWCFRRDCLDHRDRRYSRRLPETRTAARPGHRSVRVAACAPFSGTAGTRLCYGRTIGSRDPRLQVAADRCGLRIVSPCDSIARSDELRLET
jgi:hypothetical protein